MPPYTGLGPPSFANGTPLCAVLSGLSGMMVIGFGDTMASVVGRAHGRVPIHHGSRKTGEGTLAGALSTIIAWWVLLLSAGLWGRGVQMVAGGGWGLGASGWCNLILVTLGASLLEACTSQLDNVLIPLWYFPHCLLIARCTC